MRPDASMLNLYYSQFADRAASYFYSMTDESRARFTALSGKPGGWAEVESALGG